MDGSLFLAARKDHGSERGAKSGMVSHMWYSNRAVNNRDLAAGWRWRNQSLEGRIIQKLCTKYNKKNPCWNHKEEEVEADKATVASAVWPELLCTEGWSRSQKYKSQNENPSTWYIIYPSMEWEPSTILPIGEHCELQLWFH